MRNIELERIAVMRNRTPLTLPPSPRLRRVPPSPARAGEGFKNSPSPPATRGGRGKGEWGDATYWQTALKAAKDDTGAAAVEFALIVPLLLLMVLAIVELGKIVHYRSILESAARAGTQAGFGASYTTSAEVTASQATMETAADLAIANSGIGGTVASAAAVTCICSNDLNDTVTCVTGTCAGGGSLRYIATVTMTRTYAPLQTDLLSYFNINLNIDLEGKSIMWVK